VSARPGLLRLTVQAHNVDDAREIIGQHVQGHFGADPFQRFHQEVGSAHPGLDRAEGVLDRLATLTHLRWMLVEPALDRLENVFMLPSVIRRSLAVVQLCLTAQLWQALVQ